MESYEQLNRAQEFSETDPFTVERYKQFFDHFPSRVDTILDVGCNTGRGGITLKELNKNIRLIGLDCVQERLEKIPKGIYDQMCCSYSTNINMENSSVDAIVAGEFIEHLHLYVGDVVQTLREFYRLIKPGGKLLLTTPNPNYLYLKLTGGSVLGGAHVSQHYPSELKKELEEIGFINVEIFGSGKVSRLLGENFPFLMLYGSYLVVANKS